MPNYYKIPLKNYITSTIIFRHQTVNVTVNYRPTTVFHPWHFFRYLLVY